MGGFFAKRLEKIMGGGCGARRTLMVGLDAAGKTTILYKMKLGEIVTTIPTIGMMMDYTFICALCEDIGFEKLHLNDHDVCCFLNNDE